MHQGQALAGVGEIGRVCPDIVAGHRAPGAAARTGLPGAKANWRIALAVAVTVRSDGCIVVHTEAAMKAGATREEIVEALGTAAAVNAGAAQVYSARVLDTREALVG